MIKVEQIQITLNRCELRQLINEIDPSLTQKHNRLRNKLQSLLQMLLDFPILEKVLTTVDNYEHKILHNPKYL